MRNFVGIFVLGMAMAACVDAEPSADVVDSGVVGGDASVVPSETVQDDAGSTPPVDAGVEPTSAD